jgi:hypothetical protein
MLDQARIQILKLVPPHIRVVVPAAWVWNVYSLIQTLLEYIAIVFWHGSGKNTFWLKHLELGMLISRLQKFSRVWLCFGMMMKTLFFLFFCVVVYPPGLGRRQKVNTPLDEETLLGRVSSAIIEGVGDTKSLLLEAVPDCLHLELTTREP